MQNNHNLKNMNIDLIVSHYKEDLSYLDYLNENIIFIYIQNLKLNQI